MTLPVRTLFEDAMEKVKSGVSSMQEALSIARPDEKPAAALACEREAVRTGSGPW